MAHNIKHFFGEDGYERNGYGDFYFYLHNMEPLAFGQYAVRVFKGQRDGFLVDPGDLIMNSYYERGEDDFSIGEIDIASSFFGRDYDYSRRCADVLFNSAMGLRGRLFTRKRDLSLALSLARRAKEDVWRSKEIVQVDEEEAYVYRNMFVGLSQFRKKVHFAMEYKGNNFAVAYIDHRNQIEVLEKETEAFKRAINEENYERAAVLRDMVKKKDEG